MWRTLPCWVGVGLVFVPTVAARSTQSWLGSFTNRHPRRRSVAWISRGGSSGSDTSPHTPTDEPNHQDENGYTLLAQAIQLLHLESNVLETKESTDPLIPVAQLVTAFKSLSAAQKAFKGLDGVAHEAYQRTQSDDVDLSVAGRAQRSMARTWAVANGLMACELVEALALPLMSAPTHDEVDEERDPHNTTTVWTGRDILLNVTDAIPLGHSHVHVLVLFEPGYRGGVGEHHGGLLETFVPGTNESTSTGRFLIVIGDGLGENLNETIRLLNQPPRRLQDETRVSDKDSWVQPSLYQAASAVMDVLAPILQDTEHSRAAIHCTGRSLSGGIAALTAAMLNGDLPTQQARPARRTQSGTGNAHNGTSMHGWGRGRTSAVALGPPPCLSNMPLPYVTCLLYGDDIVCRLSPHSLKQFLRRTRRALQQSDDMILSKQLNWMTNTLSLTTSTLQAQVSSAHEKATRLTWAGGHVYLIRPRRLGGSCSMHEVGGNNLREAVLWQMNDVLLSRSLWKHHQLESYIHGLDRVHLRGLDEASS